MANASFTRDEVILALDVLYCSGEKHLTKNSTAIAELCTLLQELPIHPRKGRPANFRNCVGVCDQIYKHNANMTKGMSYHVGILFYQIDVEFENRHGELHQIAEAIRRNLSCYDSTFGSKNEIDGFPEGNLLGHLHRVVELRDSEKLMPGKRCEICLIDTAEIYLGCPSLMQLHLTVPVTELDGNKRYKSDAFITVCPNCHAALHRRRPWLTKTNCGELLR